MNREGQCIGLAGFHVVEISEYLIFEVLMIGPSPWGQKTRKESRILAFLWAPLFLCCYLIALTYELDF